MHDSEEHHQTFEIPDDRASSSAQKVARRTPAISLWLWYLYFQPRRFFGHFIENHIGAMTGLAALAFGCARSIDKIDFRIKHGSNPMFLNLSWSGYWTFVAMSGVIAAGLYYAIGGWWYHLRIKWSGDREADALISRRVYVYAALVSALPAIVFAMWKTNQFPTPTDAVNAPVEWWHLILAAFPVWSVIVSYIGVRTVFDVRTLPATIWFLVLPILTTVIGLVALAAIATSGTSLGIASNTVHYEDDEIQFETPSNWYLNQSDEDFEEGRFIPVFDPDSTYATAYIQIYPTSLSLEDEVSDTLQWYLDEGWHWLPDEAVKRWKHLKGFGRFGALQRESEVRHFRCFAGRSSNGLTYELRCNADANDENVERILAGFDLIAETLRVEPEWRTESVAYPPFEFKLPEYWYVKTPSVVEPTGEGLGVDESDFDTADEVEPAAGPDLALRAGKTGYFDAHIYGPDWTPVELMDSLRDLEGSHFPDWKETSTLERWGTFRGTGLTGLGTEGGTTYRIMALAAPLDDGRVLQMYGSWDTNEQFVILPSLTVIVESLRVAN